MKNGAPDWEKTLYVNLYPINADGSNASAKAIRNLASGQQEEMESYFSEEATRLGLPLRKPFAIRLGSEVKALPPEPSFGALNTLFWSLKFRCWAFQHSPETKVPANIRLFVLYHDPATHPVLKHSTALSKGRVGMVNVFADSAYIKQNDVIIAHELLHTVDATDKYNLEDNQPIYPVGYAEPDKKPLYPQQVAELMAGRRPISEAQAEIPESLAQTLIGDLTAREIGWFKAPRQSLRKFPQLKPVD
ncbi:MAG: hypothetical protein ABL885_09390 [Methylophilaceae bacterium]